MKDKILTELKKKYSGQLTTKFMESLAERLAEKVTKEEEIQGVIDELEKSPIKITDLQAEGDRRATELQKTTQELQDEIKALKEEKADPPSDDKKKGDQKDYDQEIKALQKKLEGLEKLNKQRDARATLKERAKEKKIPSVLYEELKVDSVDEVDNIVTKLEEKALALRQEIINESVKDKKPVMGSGPVGNKQQIIDDYKSHPIKKK